MQLTKEKFLEHLKGAVIAGLKTSAVILIFSIIVGLAAAFIFNKQLPNTGFVNLFFVGSGILANLVMQNHIEINSLGILMPTRILLLFAIPAISIFLLSKHKTKHMNFIFTSIWGLVLGFVVASCISLYSAVAGLFPITMGEGTNANVFAFDLLNLESFVLLILKCLAVVVVSKVLSHEKKQLNSGLTAFRFYVKYLGLAAFVLAVILEVYMFMQVSALGSWALPLNLSLVAMLANIMAYIILFSFGGIVNFDSMFVNNPHVIRVSFIELLMGDFGNFIRFFYIGCILIVLIILFFAIKRISKEKFIKDGIVFIISVLLSNIILVIGSKFIFKFTLLLGLSVSLEFVMLPILVTSLLIMFILFSFRFFVNYIQKNM